MDKGKTMAEIGQGEVFECTFQVTEEKVRLFAEATEDDNPIHLDEEEAKKSIFKTRIAHGMLSAGFISAVLGTRFPGSGTIYMGQSMKFLRPVFLGDEIKVRLTVLEKNVEKNRLKLETLCFNQKGDQVLAGEAQVMPPK